MNLSNLNIRQKIWMSFAILAALLILVGVIAYTNLKANKDALSTLVKDVQPAVVLSLNLVDQLDRSAASLGFYLLSKEEVHKKDYLENMDKINASVAELKAMPIVQADPQTLALVSEVDAGIVKLQTYKERMLTYAEKDAENVPAMKLAATEVNPRVQVLFQSLQEMILSELQEGSSKKRKQLLNDIYSLRTNLASAVNELRLYLAFRVPETVSNFRNYVELVDKDLAKLNSYGEDVLTFEQVESLAVFNETAQKYFPLAEELMKIHGAEDYRKDAFTIRKELSPLLLSIQDRLTTLVQSQSESSLQNSEALTSQVKQTMLIVAGLIAFGLLCALTIGYFLSNAITNPINTLKDNAYSLAHGNLEQEIDTKRKDELGALAQSFADMRDAIRKKLEDMSLLNVTGEIMAGMHEPMKVLEQALKVMRGKTDVEWGSVYLYDRESDRLEVKTYHPNRFGQDHSKARSFRLGEGVAGKSAQSKHAIYIADTSNDPQFEVNPGDNADPRAIICVPMVDNEEVFGVMNFSGKVGVVKFSDDDIEFAETIARMAVVSFKNIHMLNVIEEQNRTLEQKVEERTAELRQKTNDINNMLQNMHQGIFTILPGNQVHPEYSAYLEQILETKSVANADVMELLFEKTQLGSNAVDQIKAALASILGEDAMMFDFNKHCLVKDYVKVMDDGRNKILELDWDPILSESGVIEKLMVTVRDVTELRALQAEAEKQKWELEVIGQILAVSANKFLAFAKDANRFIDENEALIKQTAEKDADAIATLFRNMHTIKGNARTYNFNGVTDGAHEAESTYDRMRKDENANWDSEQMLSELYHVRELVQTYEMIYREKLSGNNADGVFIDKGLVDQLHQVLEHADANNVKELRDTVGKVRLIIQAIGTESLANVLDAIVKSMPDLAGKLGKAAPNVIIKDNNIRFTADIVPVMKNVFTHSFRNAVDHGLETIEERKSQGKPEQGTITLEVSEEQGNIVLKLSDDGRGLAINKLKRKAIERGLFKNEKEITDDKLAELIFQSGMSTADNVSDISGRGVGMDAIRKFVEKMGGKVEIRFTDKGKKNVEFRHFESRIILPANVSVRVA